MFGLLRSLTLGFAALALLHPPAQLQAQGYPSKPVTVIVPLAPGTGMDSLVRLYAEPLAQALGKPVVVENKPGAGLMLGTAAIATAAPDGHTLGISTATPIAVNPVLNSEASKRPDRIDYAASAFPTPFFRISANPRLKHRGGGSDSA